jgi:alanine racemase
VNKASAGFGDGIPRRLTKSKNGAGGFVISQGKRCPYIGGVNMDLVAVDTSESGYVELGDIVELIGPSVTIDDFAASAGISGFEALTQLEATLPSPLSEAVKAVAILDDRKIYRRHSQEDLL